MTSFNTAKKSRSIWILSSLLLSCILGMMSITSAAENIWTYKTDIPTARTWVGGGIIEGKIYVIGGATSTSSVTSAVEMYDPITDTWTTMANMPSTLCAHATCVFDGKIYVFGGVSPGVFSTAKKNVYVYDPQMDTWTQKADMPYANAHCGIAVVDDTIYLIGGMLSVSNSPVSTVMAYNPMTESWTQKADMPTARGLLSACVVDGKVYAIGGATEDWGTFCYKQTEVYDPTTDTWTRKSDMPTERFSLGTCVVNGKIYAIGGHLKNDACTANEIYDPITDTWITDTPLQHKRLGHFLGLVEDKIYAIGGSFPNPAPTIIYKVEEYNIGLSVPQPDFNGDGIVDIKDLLRLIESWGQDDPTVDVVPLPYGDGIVDALDLELLMSYWEQPFEDPSLIAHWALDETEGVIAYDSAGVSDAYLMGEPVWLPDSGMVDGALMLNGINDYAFAPLDLSPADGPFSVFAWIKGGLPGQTILSQSDGANWIGVDKNFGCLMTELVPPAVGRFRPQPLESDTVITDDQWHRVGFVWNGVNRALYVDDIPAAEDMQEGLADSSGVLNIGCGNNLTAGTFWSGLIDDVRIYNRAVRP